MKINVCFKYKNIKFNGGLLGWGLNIGNYNYLLCIWNMYMYLNFIYGSVNLFID